MRRPILAVLLGAASVPGFAPLAWYPLPILTLALLFRLWQDATPRGAAGLGFAWGLGFFLAGVSWVYVSLHDVGGMAAPLAVVATLLFCAYLSVFPAVAGYLGRRFASADPGRHALLLAGLWMLSEWLRGGLFTGFPWLAVGYSQTPPSPLAGYAAVLGSYGIGFLVAWIAGLLARLSTPDGKPRAAWLAILFILGGGVLLRGMDWTQPAGPPVATSLLQGNIAQRLKWEPGHLSESIEAYLGLARDNPAPLTLLPETAIPLLYDQVPAEVVQALRQHGDVLFGVAIRHREDGYVNGAVALASGDVQSYAKRHLVPFGEYVPPGFAWFFDLVRIPMSDFAAGGDRQAPLDLAGQRIAANICYEDLFGEEIITSLPQATLLVNLSNTAWFGDSLAQPQHLQIARMRALETGRMMLRATNTGITAAIAPDGRVLGTLPAFTAGALRIEAQGFTGLTPYARWGNGLALLLAIGAVLPAFLAGYRSRRNR